MRAALIIGINHYDKGSQLYGCVNDAHEVKAALERHGDGSINFDCKLLTATGPSDRVTRADLKDGIHALFAGDPDVALFYFAGHGHIDATGGYILGSDADRGDSGLSLTDVLVLANKSRAKNKIVVLDSCHSGIAGDAPTAEGQSALSEGLTVLSASTKEQDATEENDRGVVFTVASSSMPCTVEPLISRATSRLAVCTRTSTNHSAHGNSGRYSRRTLSSSCHFGTSCPRSLFRICAVLPSSSRILAMSSSSIPHSSPNRRGVTLACPHLIPRIREHLRCYRNTTASICSSPSA